jgi:hypothetical protein
MTRTHVLASTIIKNKYYYRKQHKERIKVALCWFRHSTNEVSLSMLHRVGCDYWLQRVKTLLDHIETQTFDACSYEC